MVKALPILMAVLPTLVTAEPIDETWLRNQLAPVEAEHAQRNARTKVADGLTVKTSDPIDSEVTGNESAQQTHQTTDVEKAQSAETSSKPVSASAKVTKYSDRQTSRSTPTPIRKVVPTDPDLYIPPPRMNTVSTTHSKVFNEATRTFGIVLGTWARAQLVRRITNADNGQVEVTLEQAIDGKKRTLPAGSVLFGGKGFNQTSQRLDVTLTRGITPDGDEFALAATVYDEHKVSGLKGSVVRQRDDEIRTAASKGALTSARSLMAATLDSVAAGAIADGVAQAGGELIDNEQQFVPTPRAFIQVSPQPVLIRIDRTF